ncbi:MAG: ANTAR domain-containing protein [Gammaproteobacteria bacterium]|nr:MAG: ANTAR domain-containing protein [Gammaproteobacteria bacterium]
MKRRVLIVTNRNERAALIEQALTSTRHAIVARIVPDDDFSAYLEQARPEALVFDLEAPTPDVLRRLERLLQQAPLPVVVFADRSDRESIQAAVKAGVGAFVVDGFRPSRVLPVLEAACARFREFQSLRRERDAAILQLAERKTVERAKGILMRRRQLAEDEAYTALRKMAMDKNKRLVEVADSIVTAEDILTDR